MKRLMFASLAVACFSTPPPAAPVVEPPPPTSPRQDSLDTLIVAKMQDADIVGLAGAVYVDGREVWSGGYGHRDLSRTLPFTPSTPMPIASITKTFTGAAMMRLVAEGRLELDADVNGYLPFPIRNPRFSETPITLRMIATHTSSITDRWEIYRESYRWGGGETEPLATFTTRYFALDGDRYSPDNYTKVAPGTERDYSNIGAAVTGVIIERIAGESLAAYTRRHFLEPLGMNSTTWSPDESATTLPSALFMEHEGWAVPVTPYHLVTYPDGGVRSTVHDLGRFFLALLADGVYEGVRILPADAAREMTRFQFSGPDYPGGYGPDEGNTGLFWRTRRNGELVGHGGNDPGIQTAMLATLDRRVAVVLLANTSGAMANRAYDEIFMALKAFGEAQRGT